MSRIAFIATLVLAFAFSSCTEDPIEVIPTTTEEENNTGGDSDDSTNDENNTDNTSSIQARFGQRVNLDNLPNYANQAIPGYINADNTRGNGISDIGATLGRVLFYDRELSVNRTVACASCHRQEVAFGDQRPLSLGVDGTTGRHSMRLVNARFADEVRFFWDERAATLEAQTTQPIQDHVEMGFSGQNGDPSFDDLIERLGGLGYYRRLFTEVYGDPSITEERVQLALAQFIRSIQSFDSKYDQGRQQVNNDNQPFPNFTTEENRGKQLFLGRPQFNNQGQRIGGGLGCQGCHQAPSFAIAPNSRNNGVISVAGDPTTTDLTNTKSPSLRDLFNADGTLNGPMMHDGSFATFGQVIDHYNAVPNNPQLDNRLRPGGNPQRLNITAEERAALEAFVKTLSGNSMYNDARWSNPFLP